MSDNVKFLGYDRDGAEVWQIARGIVVGDADVYLAEEYAAMLRSNYGRPGIPLDSYQRQFGPITKEKP